ncbi:TRAP transporter small permease [Sphaerochaeta sp.]|uniref:TRAP transporter small permease n=1 Tax=Sphaerochaeta sp. TaxID=1972642 RepID=UPI002FCB7933
MKILEKLWKAIDIILEYLMAVCFGVMTIAIFLQVVFRYVLKSPLSWSEELARYLFVWVSFIGGVIAARNGQHIGVELLVKKIPEKIQKGFTCFANFLTSFFFLIIFVFFCKMWPMLSMQKTSALLLPMSYPYLGLGIGCFLMAFMYLMEAIKPFTVGGNN